MRSNMSKKKKYDTGDRIVFYNLQPIPRKDMKKSWVDDRPLSIYGYKKVHGTVKMTQPTYDRLWVKPDDRAYEMMIRNVSEGFAHPETEDNKLDATYIYLADLKKGDPLYFGGGCIPGLKDKKNLE